MMLAQLRKLEQNSLKRGIPIIGKDKGKWLYEIVLELEPKTILELGTANGYSGIILGSQGALITTVDIDSRIQEEAKKNFKKFNINAQVVNEDAVEFVKKLDSNHKKYDLIFIDFAKRKYIEVLENCIKLLNEGGCIIADNISFLGCQDFKEAVLIDPRLKTKIIDIKDGLSVSCKR